MSNHSRILWKEANLVMRNDLRISSRTQFIIFIENVTSLLIVYSFLFGHVIHYLFFAIKEIMVLQIVWQHQLLFHLMKYLEHWVLIIYLGLIFFGERWLEEFVFLLHSHYAYIFFHIVSILALNLVAHNHVDLYTFYLYFIFKDICF